jgi:hypothetical protein
VFFRDGDRVFRTYFVNERHDEAMGTIWNYLDITPLGRQETWEGSPEGYPQTPPYKWWNWHDNYDAEASPDPKWALPQSLGIDHPGDRTHGRKLGIIPGQLTQLFQQDIVPL